MKQAEKISKRFKIRCSAISQIMAGGIGLTETQENKLKTLQERKDDPNAKPLTEKMQIELDGLIYAKENPELPQGAKTYCKNWVKSQPEFYGEKIRFDFKYTQKGLEMEDEALTFVAENYGYGLLIKNEERKSNEFITGEADNVQPDHTLDTKCSWDSSTFPIFETELDSAYFWQGQGYMDLYNKERHIVFYCLMNTPKHLIDQEFNRQSRKLGLTEEEEEDFYSELYEKMTFDHIDPNLRIKSFEIKKDLELLRSVYQRVTLCREFIFKLLSE